MTINRLMEEMETRMLAKMQRLGTTAGLLLVMCMSASACTATIDHRGFMAETPTALEITPGTDNKTTLLERLGNPSQQGVFDQQVWYYITSVERQQAFYDPVTTERRVVAIRFDDDDSVLDVRTFGLTDGRLIAFNDNRTPTRGREVTLIEQIFGSVGRQSVNLPGQDPNLPSSAGGPRRN